VENFTDDESKSFLNDSETKALWQNTKKISDVNAEDYRAIFVVGGVGATKDND
jgi:putative intracellular protease/amidase